MFIVVLGGGINLQGQIPPHVYQRLDKALELYKKYPTSKIILTGKYSFLYGKTKPPTTEAAKMSEYLRQKGVPPSQIFLEDNSQDTISNAYYLKTNFFLPMNQFNGTIVTSHFHLERVKLIFHKVFGSNYNFEYIGIQEQLPKEEEEKIITRQNELLLKIGKFLSTMKIGDHEFLKGKFYKADYYREKRPAWVTNFVAKGK